MDNPQDIGIHDPWLDQIEELERNFRELEDEGDRQIPEGTVEGQEPTEDTLELAALYSRLETQRRRMKAALDELEKTQEKLGRVLHDRCVEAGVRNIPVGGFTLRPTRKLWVNKQSDVDAAQVCSALRAMGRGDLVSEGYNTSSVKAYVNELLENSRDGQLPAEIATLFQYGWHEEIGATVQR